MSIPAVAWFEVTGKNGAELQHFYRNLFDWDIQDSGGETGYGIVQAAEKGISGGIGSSPNGGSGQVTFYVEVDDPDAYLEKAEQLGGQKIVPPTEIPQLGLTLRRVPRSLRC